jgi:hypothetical protein
MMATRPRKMSLPHMLDCWYGFVARYVSAVSRKLSDRVGENAVFRSHVMRNLDALNAAVLMTTRVAVVSPLLRLSAPESHVYAPSRFIFQYR